MSGTHLHPLVRSVSVARVLSGDMICMTGTE